MFRRGIVLRIKGRITMYLSVYSLLYFLLVIFPYLAFGFCSTRLFVGIPDLIDLTLYVPVFSFILLSIFWCYDISNIPDWLRFLAYFSLVLHFWGHGFHWAANAVDVALSNNSAPSEVINFAYFLDEILGHIFMFSGLLLFVFVLTYIDIIYVDEYPHFNRIRLGFFGFFLGFSLTLAFIEGQYIRYALILCAIYIISLLLYCGKTRNTLIFRSPFIYFWIIAFLSIFVWSSIYVAIFGDFYQPSELFG